jgi:hypothetical protein
MSIIYLFPQVLCFILFVSTSMIFNNHSMYSFTHSFLFYIYTLFIHLLLHNIIYHHHIPFGYIALSYWVWHALLSSFKHILFEVRIVAVLLSFIYFVAMLYIYTLYHQYSSHLPYFLITLHCFLLYLSIHLY